MKVLRAMLKADLRNLRPLLAVLGVLYVIRLGAMVGWFGTPAPDLAPYSGGMSSIFISLPVLVTSGILVMMLSNYPPLARGAFLATRPVTAGRRVITRALVLGLMFWLPSLAVDLLALVLTAQPAGRAFPALADSALWNGAWLAALMPAFWLWRSKGETMLGMAAVAVALGLSALAVWGWFEAARIGHEGAFFASAMTRMRIFWTLLVMALVLWGLLTWQWMSGWLPLGRRLLLVAGVTALSAACLYLIPRGESDVLRKVSCDGAQARLIAKESPMLELQAAITQVDTDEHRAWSIKGLELDGRKIPIWNQPISMPPIHSIVGAGGSIQWNMADRIAKDLGVGHVLVGQVLPPGIAVQSWIGQSLGGVNLREGEMPEVSVDLRGRAFRWEKVAELPVEEGAQDGGWTLVQDTRRGSGEQPAAAATGGSQDRALSLHFREVRGFLEDLSQGWPFCFVLVDDENGLVEISRYGSTTLRSSGVLGWYGYRVEFRENLTPKQSPKRERLWIYRLVGGDHLSATWKGRVKVEGRPRPGQGLAERKRDKEPAEVAAWMRDNPPPAPDAEEKDLRSYLVALLGQLNESKRWLPEDHPATGWFTSVVAQRDDGIELMLRARAALAMNDHQTQGAIDSALAAGFSREDLPALIEIEKVLHEAVKRGWLGDISDHLLKRARRGDAKALEMLMKLPDQGGMTRNELFNLFLQRPEPWLYQLLRQDEALKAMMDRKIREWFDTTIPSIAPQEAPGFPLELALTAGFPDAPKRVHRLGTLLGTNYLGGRMDMLIDRYFGSPGNWPGGQFQEFFMKQNPDDFVFDEKTGKYRLKGGPR